MQLETSMSKVRYCHSMDYYYSAVKKALVLLAATWMRPRIIALKEARHESKLQPDSIYIKSKLSCND